MDKRIEVLKNAKIMVTTHTSSRVQRGISEMGTVLRSTAIKLRSCPTPDAVRAEEAFMPSRSLLSRPTRLRDSAIALPQPKRINVI